MTVARATTKAKPTAASRTFLLSCCLACCSHRSVPSAASSSRSSCITAVLAGGAVEQPADDDANRERNRRCLEGMGGDRLLKAVCVALSLLGEPVVGFGS